MTPDPVSPEQRDVEPSEQDDEIARALVVSWQTKHALRWTDDSPTLRYDIALAIARVRNEGVSEGLAQKCEAVYAEQSTELARLRGELDAMRQPLSQDTINATVDGRSKHLPTLGTHLALQARHDNQRAELNRLNAELDAMRGERDGLAQLAREISCVWCGWQSKTTLREQHAAMQAHAEFCEKHPIRTLAAVRARAEAAEGREAKLRDAVSAVLREPYGCAWCDSGTLRKPGVPDKEHDPQCPYVLLHAALTESASHIRAAIAPEGK